MGGYHRLLLSVNFLKNCISRKLLETPYPPITLASKEEGIVPGTQSSKSDILPSEKKQNTLPLSNKKKEENKEKTKLTQESCKHRRKGQSRKIVQGYTQISDQEESGGEWAGNFGIAWVQCSFPSCEKWRQLHGNINSSSILPDNWSCSQNTGGQLDPDLGEYFLFTSQQDVLPAKYHVTFFGNSVSRAWISSNMLKNFQELSLEQVERDQVSLFGFSSRCKENASEPDSSEEEGDIFFKETKKTQSTGSSNSGFSKEESKVRSQGFLIVQFWG
uniref:CW-type domain-containing protein n=1 Tax=Monodelphis domestica TaxID=13616 RepID=A0A5F8GS79_MONDO